jgi:predicted DsbA family dithiol-disulfide isomerase
MTALPIDIWSDIACPWCWVGKRHLEAAVAATGIAVDRRWRAFELDPEAPREAPESVDYAQRLADKYRTSKQAAQEMIDRMVETGRAAGVEMRFDRIRPSRTFDAHRLLAWAREAGFQDALGERLFAAYLGEGRAMSDPETLTALAEEVGLDGSEATELLRSDRHADAVRAEQRQAARMGITGVPTFVLADRLAVTGAQPPALLREAIERAFRTE